MFIKLRSILVFMFEYKIIFAGIAILVGLFNYVPYYLDIFSLHRFSIKEELKQGQKFMLSRTYWIRHETINFWYDAGAF